MIGWRHGRSFDGSCRHLLLALAILGSGSPPLVAAVAELDPLEVARARDRLIAAALLADARELRFPCRLLQQVVASGLARSERTLGACEQL